MSNSTSLDPPTSTFESSSLTDLPTTSSSSSSSSTSDDPSSSPSTETTTTPPPSSAPDVTTAPIETVTTVESGAPSVITESVLTTLSTPDPIDSTPTATPTEPSDTGSAAPSATSGTQQSGGSGAVLHGTSRVVVAVVVPIGVIVLIAIGALIWWRRREKKTSQMKRKSEVEDYSFNPNAGEGGAVGGMGAHGSDGDVMEESTAGYRGWGSTNGGMKMSTMSSSVGSGQPLSPVTMGFADGGAFSDGGVSNAALVRNRSDATDSNGAGPVGGDGVHRGDSNASSNYSAMTRSDQSESGIPAHYDTRIYGPDGVHDEAYNYSTQRPYVTSPPIIQDVQARRNTRIETPTSAHFPQQGNSGIAQNF